MLTHGVDQLVLLKLFINSFLLVDLGVYGISNLCEVVVLGIFSLLMLAKPIFKHVDLTFNVVVLRTRIISKGVTK